MRPLLRCLSAVSALLLLLGCQDQPAPTPVSSEHQERLLQSGSMMSTPYVTSGISQPVLEPGTPDSLPAQERVIGVIVDDQARAYRVSVMSSRAAHVINDLAGQTPISITYCDRTDCTRVMTRDPSTHSSGQPISLSLGGFTDGEMIVMLDGQSYPQSSPQIPLADHEFQLTTWSDWLNQHPQTLVYKGDNAPTSN